MKKIILLCVFAISASAISTAQIKKAALISVFGNRNLSDDPMDTKLYEALLKDSSFDISGTVNKFEALIQDEFISQFPFEFKDKESIVSSEDYKALDSIVTYKQYVWEKNNLSKAMKEFGYDQIIPAEGYVNVAALGIVTDKRAIRKAFEIFPDIDAVMIAYIDFNLYNAGGIIPSKKVYGYVNIKLFDKDAKRIFKMKEKVSSSKKAVAIGGLVLEPEKLKPMVFDAADKLFVDMKKNMPKDLAKLARKLKK